MSTKHIHVGIDTSISGTGVAILTTDERGVVLALSASTVDTSKCKTLGQKYLAIQQYIITVMDGIKSDHEVVKVYSAIEGGAYAGSGKIFELGGAWGCAMSAMAAFDIDPVIVTPASLKKYATGDSSASKADVQKAIESDYNIQEGVLQDDNQADAAALALYSRTMVTGSAPSVAARISAATTKKKLTSPKAKTRAKKPRM